MNGCVIAWCICIVYVCTLVTRRIARWWAIWWRDCVKIIIPECSTAIQIFSAEYPPFQFKCGEIFFVVRCFFSCVVMFFLFKVWLGELSPLSNVRNSMVAIRGGSEIRTYTNTPKLRVRTSVRASRSGWRVPTEWHWSYYWVIRVGTINCVLCRWLAIVMDMIAIWCDRVGNLFR